MSSLSRHGLSWPYNDCGTFEVTDSIRTLVLQKAEVQDVQREAIKQGMRTMFWHGMTKAFAGVTSLEEVLRVTQAA